MYQKWLIQFFTVLFIFVYQVNSQLERTCITPNNQPANCTSVYKCQTFLDILKTSTSSQRKYMKESLCGHYRNIPIVCCGTDTDYIKQSSRSKRELNRNPAIPESICGKSLSDGSVVGNTVMEHDFPWTVRLGYNNTPKFSCEGTLINKRYVLTAGVCIEPKTLKRVGNLSTIRLGDQNCPTVESKCEKSNVVDAGVEKVILHPTYSSSPKLHDDIGLIRLDRDITFNDDVAPICLPRPNEAAKPDDKVVEVGWYKNSENKLQAPITVASKEQCNERYKKLGVVLTEKQMCAGGYPDNKCAGTSGGPLNRYVGDSWVIEGITSFGTVTCNSDFPTVFTKVEPYLQWIHDNVQN